MARLERVDLRQVQLQHEPMMVGDAAMQRIAQIARASPSAGRG